MVDSGSPDAKLTSVGDDIDNEVEAVSASVVFETTALLIATNALTESYIS